MTGETRPEFFLDATPVLRKGVRIYENLTGDSCMRIHYSADPLKTDSWAASQRVGIDRRQWLREMELHHIGSGDAVVFEDFVSDIHAPSYLRDNNWVCQPGARYILGLDIGGTLNPAAVCIEVGPSFQCVAIWEIDCGGVATPAHKFLMMCQQVLRDRFPASWQDVIWVADRTIGHRDPNFGMSGLSVANRLGILIKPMTNNINKRLSDVQWSLMRWIDDGVPGFYVCGFGCPVLLSGFEGGYAMERPLGKSSNIDLRKPAKTKFSHVQDALQYGLMQARDWYESSLSEFDYTKDEELVHGHLFTA